MTNNFHPSKTFFHNLSVLIQSFNISFPKSSHSNFLSFVRDEMGLILKELKECGGTILLGDKSTPDEIYDRFQISKSAFKKAIGGLYKERIITVSDNEIKIVVDHLAD